MTQHQILAAVVDGTLFGMVKCDVCVPRELQDHFAEMQPIFKNTTVTRNDIGPFMRDYAEYHDSMSKLRCAGGREFDPRPGQYSRMSFSSDPGDWYGFLI